MDLTLEHTNHRDWPKVQKSRVSPVDGLAQQLDDDQVQQLVKGYQAGATV